MPYVLVVDDDAEIRELLDAFLQRHGYDVTQACDGPQMMQALDGQRIDLVILDVMLKGEDGFSLCRQLRAVSKVPVIMLTAMSDPTDRVVGLEIGADDYITKPFDQRELLARIRAVMRRVSDSGETDRRLSDARPVFCFDSWRLDVARQELRSEDGVLVILPPSEFSVLLALIEHSQRVLSRDQLLDIARGQAYDVYDRSIDVLVSRIRRKIEQDPRSPEIIKTIRNGGYIFTRKVSVR